MNENISTSSLPPTEKRALTLALIVSALGYFVDIYDLVLFSIVRTASLRSLGLEGQALLDEGVRLLNMQMGGMLIGGIVWGILGDRRGRVSVLFGSIFLYSLANIANAFVSSVDQYAVLRFIAGVGLAGELGAAITLVSEMMSKESRGFGTTLIASVGVSGAIVAGFVGETFSWNAAYIVGGVLGLVLLSLRVGTLESGMFRHVKARDVSRGNVLLLVAQPGALVKYISCILVGVPIWFVIGILITFSPEISQELGVEGAVTGGRAILYCYLGLIFGDLLSGLGSQFLKSRKKMLLIFISMTAVLMGVYVKSSGYSVSEFYMLCVALGFAVGYWAVFVTVASEQFGTNIRATATTTIPNFVRGSVVPLTLSFQYLHQSRGWSLTQSALSVGVVAIALALFSILLLEETYGKDLNYVE